MAFVQNDRVKVTAESSAFRHQLGTVEVPAASAADGYNKVRLDGHPVGRTMNLADAELRTTSFPSPVEY